MHTLYRDEARRKIWSLIKDIKLAMMSTFSPEGHIFHARPMMALQTEFEDGVLWFFTAADSRKAEEIHLNPDALLTYADKNKENFVSVSGRATIEHDQAKIDELWTDYAKVWFPKGKDDPNLALIRFEADEAEFWDSPGPLATGIAYVKAFVSGQKAHMGETGKADLSH